MRINYSKQSLVSNWFLVGFEYNSSKSEEQTKVTEDRTIAAAPIHSCKMRFHRMNIPASNGIPVKL